MRIQNLILLFLFLSSVFTSTLNAADFVKGADVSWLSEMEKESNFKFYNKSGVAQDCFQILKDYGINTIRLRTWVNPNMLDWVNGHCSKAETIKMAVHAKSWGMRIMIDFHYSDTWADPAKQTKPATWANHTYTQLLNDVYDYTYKFMTSLDSAGVTPEWVQVGNEISSGMLFPEGSTSNWSQLAQLINKGYDAVKAVKPTTKVVLHVDRGNDNGRFRWWFDNAKNYGAKYDVIGLSYYPYWLSGSPDYTLSINDLGNNLLDMVSRYGKEVMIVETGGPDTKGQNTKDMLVAVINKLLAVPYKAGLGLIYWEPQASRNWGQYPLSAWSTGTNPQPNLAMDVFLTPTPVINTSESKLNVKYNSNNGTLIFNEVLSSIHIINLNGNVLRTIHNTSELPVANFQKGVYLLHVKSFDNKSAIIKYLL